MLADAAKSMDVGAEQIHGNSGNSTKKSASKKPVSGDQMDFLL